MVSPVVIVDTSSANPQVVAQTPPVVVVPSVQVV
jgi:hypothetical protein